MEVVSAITAKLVEYAVLPIGRQLGYLFCYSSNVSDLTGKAKELQEAKESLEHLVVAARNNGEEIESSVLSWLSKVDEISGKVENFQGDAGQARTGCTNLWSRRQLSRRAKKMGEAIVKIQEAKKFEDNISYCQLPKFTEAVPTIPGHEDFKSTISVLEEIMKSLRDPTVNMIGVCGLGGVGKTTLVNRVGKKAQEDKLFDVVALVAVTIKPEVDKIQTEIADMLGLKFEDQGELLRAIRLRKRLKQEKNILIILDDLWTRLDLGKIGIPSVDDHKGIKILLTARDTDVLHNQMNVKKLFSIEVLSQEEALKLFKDTAELHDTNENSDLQSIAAEVAKMCNGLPLALVTVARALMQKDISVWRDGLRQLKSPHTGETTEMTEGLKSCMSLSYDRLESQELKSTFLLCASSSGYYISKSYLLKYCVGLGLFKGIFTIQEAQEKLETWVCRLKASSLLQAGKTSDDFTMHDIVRTAAISIARKDKCVFTMRYDKLNQWLDKDELEHCTAITLLRCDICCEFPQVLDCPKLEYLYIHSKDPSLIIPEDFFRGMCNLRMMDLTQIYLRSLPSSIALLDYLQTLCLDLCTLDDVAMIGELKNLKILSFVSSDIKQLPRELGKLTQLQLLDLRGCSKLEIIPPNIFSSLKRLEELNMENSFVGWENEVSNSQGINARLSELDCLHQLTSLNIWIRDSSILQWELFIKLKKYRILIGDVWNWSGKYITSRTLKLKLNISFHLVPRIKRLLERVEDLHLDELNGVTNILYQLNGEGFPSLKHLLIQNNDEIELIVNSKDPKLFHYGDVFPILESLIIHNLINLEQICIGPLSATSFGKLEVIKVEGCHKLKNLFAFSMVRSLKRLHEIGIIACNILEEIVILERAENCNDDIDSSNLKFDHLHSLTLQDLPKLDGFYFDGRTSSVVEKSDTVMPFFCEKVQFPKLETLKLSSINFQKIWQDQPLTSSWIQNLTNLIVEGCKNLKYLFSYTVAGSLVKLKHLKISNCQMLEEILPTESEGAIRNSTVDILPHSDREDLFPTLETLVISNMDNLKAVWCIDPVAPNSFGKLKSLEIKRCEKLLAVVPSNMLRRLQNLETLEVDDCGSLNEIFRLDGDAENHEKVDTPLKKLSLSKLSNLKHIWNRDPQENFNFRMLKVVEVLGCRKLQNIFPASVAKCLQLLEELAITCCAMLEEIVAKEETILEATARFVFPQLSSILLVELRVLESFSPGPGVHTIECPKLKTLNVKNCPRLDLLGKESSNHEETNQVDQLDVEMKQPLFLIEKVIPSLEELGSDSKYTMRLLDGQSFPIVFPRKLRVLAIRSCHNKQSIDFLHGLLQGIPTLQRLELTSSSFKELCGRSIIQVGTTMVHLKRLTLWNLPNLENICREGSQLDPLFEMLESLEVVKCSSLIKLAPSSVSFKHLTSLVVKGCDKLVFLVPSTTAKSLHQLKALKITECKMIEELIENDSDEEDEIEFSHLLVLELGLLPELKSFCSANSPFKFPQLRKVIVKRCPKMNVFSKGALRTPKLHRVVVEGTEDEWYWERNLNATIEKLSHDKVAFRSIEKLELYEFPELKGIWHRKFPNKSFSKLRELIVEKCDFVSNVISLELLLLLNNLEELKVGSCDLVEAVFDLESTDDIEEYHGQNRAAIHLRKLTVSHLPRLTNVWNKDSTGFFSFMNLQEIHVLNCVSLKYLFPASVAKGLERLKELEIDSCAQMKDIVAMEEGIPESKITINFVFPRVISVCLKDLPELEHFYPGPHTVEWPKLEGIYTIFCGKLEIFTIDSINLHETDPEDDQQVAIIQQPMFSIEKVLPNIEALSLDGKDAMRIWNDQYVVDDLFRNLTFLRLQSFDDEQAASNFPYCFIQKIPNLKGLVVKYSSFQEIFPCQRHEAGETHTMTVVQLRRLDLWALPKLEEICKDGFQLHPILEILETLRVWECSALLDLVPSTVSFNYLKKLDVWKCNGMLHLLTSTTAKSLVQITEMKIRECEIIQEIVFDKEDQGEVEIVLDRLENLELECLPSLINFCGSMNLGFSFPSLEKVIVRQCPKMQVFSCGVSTTPKLQRVKVEKNGYEWYWEGNLNATTEKMSNHMEDMVVFNVTHKETTPFNDQKPGTSGLRKKVKVFVQPNYLQNFVQSTYNAMTPEKVKGATLVVSGDGRYFSKEAIQIITKMAAANGVRRVWIGLNVLLSTPAVSAVIRERVGADGSKAAGAFVLTASHNPGGPHEDFGIKYNMENGGPAPEAITDKIYENTKTINEYLIAEDLPDVDITTAGVTKFSGPEGQFDVEVFDSATEYLKLVK